MPPPHKVFLSFFLEDKTSALDVFSSLRGRHLEVVGERENGCARGRQSRGERAPARKATENRFNSPSVSADISNWSRGSRGKN